MEIKIKINTQDEYNRLMTIFELNKVEWMSGAKPSAINTFSEPCIVITLEKHQRRNAEYILTYHPRYYEHDDANAFTVDEFFGTHPDFLPPNFIYKQPQIMPLKDFLKSENFIIQIGSYNVFMKFVSLLTQDQKSILADFWETLSYKIYSGTTYITSKLIILPNFKPEYTLVCLEELK